MSTYVNVDPSPLTSVVVTITLNGATAAVFSDAALTQAVTLPATVTALTRFYYAAGQTVVVSGTVNGQEVFGPYTAEEHETVRVSPVLRETAETKGAVAATQQTDTTYTFVLSDAGTTIEFTNAGAVTATVPANSAAAYPTGTKISIYSAGAGGVTIAPDSGVTIRNNSVALAQYAEVSLRKRGTNEWVRVG